MELAIKIIQDLLDNYEDKISPIKLVLSKSLLTFAKGIKTYILTVIMISA